MNRFFREIYFWAKVAASLWVLLYLCLARHYFKQIEHQTSMPELSMEVIPIWRPYCVIANDIYFSERKYISLYEYLDEFCTISMQMVQFDECQCDRVAQSEDFMFALRWLSDIVDLEIGDGAICGLRKVQNKVLGEDRKEFLGMCYFIFAKALKAPIYFEKEADFIEACKSYGLTGRNRQTFEEIHKQVVQREEENDSVVNYWKEVFLHPPTRWEYGVASFWFLLWGASIAIALYRHRVFKRNL